MITLQSPKQTFPFTLLLCVVIHLYLPIASYYFSVQAQSMERYTIGEQIGEGSFGNVFLAVKKDTNEKVNPLFRVVCVHGLCVTL
jgi:hypothetical protein